MAQQLGLPLVSRPAQGRADFLVAPSNEAAFEFVDRWPDWPVRAAALYGPQGSGKSHLAAVWRTASRAETLAAEDLTLESAASLGAGLPVVIEDLDAAEATPERDAALMALFERPTGAILLTGRTVPALWAASVGDLHSRFSALLAFPMGTPDDTLLGALGRKLFLDRGLVVPDGVIKRMLLAIERTPASVSAFVERADAKALAERRPVSERLVLELLES